MLISLLCYFAFLIVILVFLEVFNDFLWHKSGQFYKFFLDFKSKKIFQTEEKSGKELLVIFPEIELKLAIGIKTTSISLPQYKFYTGLLIKLLQVHLKRGISLKLILPELRQNLIKDLQFESKLKSNVLGGNLQFLAIFLTTWVFILLSSSISDLPFNLGILFFILIIQILGSLAFNSALYFLKNNLKNNFNQIFERLYMFIGLVEIGTSVGDVLSESKILEGKLFSKRRFSQVGIRIQTLIKIWQLNGLSPKIESSEIVKEIWHLKEENFTLFLKQVEILKFIVLAFFFLPAYFLYLYSIFQYFLEAS